MLQANVHWLAGAGERPALAGILDSGQSLVLTESAGRLDPLPLEVMLLALAASSARGVLAVLRRRRVGVSAYEVRVQAEQHLCSPPGLSSVCILHRFSGEGLERSSLERAIAISRRRLDVVGSMIERVAPVRHVVEIVE